MQLVCIELIPLYEQTQEGRHTLMREQMKSFTFDRSYREVYVSIRDLFSFA